MVIRVGVERPLVAIEKQSQRELGGRLRRRIECENSLVVMWVGLEE